MSVSSGSRGVKLREVLDASLVVLSDPSRGSILVMEDTEVLALTSALRAESSAVLSTLMERSLIRVTVLFYR